MSHRDVPVRRPRPGLVPGLVATDTVGGCRSVLGTYPECPLCGGDLFPEHAHFKCGGCGWRDSCCD